MLNTVLDVIFRWQVVLTDDTQAVLSRHLTERGAGKALGKLIASGLVDDGEAVVARSREWK